MQPSEWIDRAMFKVIQFAPHPSFLRIYLINLHLSVENIVEFGWLEDIWSKSLSVVNASLHHIFFEQSLNFRAINFFYTIMLILNGFRGISHPDHL